MLEMDALRFHLIRGSNQGRFDRFLFLGFGQFFFGFLDDRAGGDIDRFMIWYDI